MRNIYVLFFLLMVSSGLFAQAKWVGAGSSVPVAPVVQVSYSDNSELLMEISIPGMFVENITADGKTWQRISILENQTTHEVGFPELPTINKILGIPDNQKISYVVESMETQKFTGYNVYPFQTPSKDVKGGKPDKFVINNEFYASSRSVYPANNVTIDQPGIWRDVKIAGFHLTPVTFHPASKELTLITHIKIRIDFNGFDHELVLNRSKEVMPNFYRMYEKSILNFSQLGMNPVYRYRDNDDIKYLIITNTGALNAIQPLVDWKNQQGFKVEVRTLEPGFNQPQNFKDYITTLFNDDDLEYVLMVGDAYPNGGSGGGPNKVPMYYWAPGGDPSYSDSWYTCLDGNNDHYADLAIGRIVYDNDAELQLQIQKTMTHYQNPDVSTNWAERTILVAHKEEYPGKYTQCCEEIRTFPYELQVPIFQTCYGGAGASNQDIINYINQNSVGIFNYRGHGSTTELWEWGNYGSFTATHVNQLTNNNRLFVTFDVCCDNMDIVAYNGNCLCESFMKHPTATVAINGAIIPSYTIPNHDYDKEMYKAVFNEGILNIGYVTNYANITVLNVHGEIGKSNVRTYLWLGDASIEPWTKTPTPLTVTHDSQIFLGLSEFEVMVNGNEGPVENARVCVVDDNGSVYAVALTDASGIANVTIDGGAQMPGTATVTVTAHNHTYYQQAVPIIPPSGPYVVKDNYTLNDPTGNGNGVIDYGEDILMSLTVKNVGVAVASNVSVTISSADEYITITDATAEYGNIEAGQTATVTDGFAFTAADNFPDNHSVLMTVTATDGTNIWTSNLSMIGNAPVLELGDYLINDASGNSNGKIDPGETVQITVNVNNTGSSAAYNVMELITTSDLYLTINTSAPQPCGDIDPGASGQATFTATAAPNTPAGHSAQIDVAFNGDLGIGGSGSFNVIIGQIPVLVVDLDGNHNSPPIIKQTINDLGVTCDLVTTLPANLSLYSSIFVCLGIYSSNHVLSAAEGQALAAYLNAGGSLYMEGGDTWYYDTQTAVHTMFKITASGDGSSDLGTISGQTGTFTEGMSFTYSGDNNWIDRIDAVSPAAAILKNQTPAYGTAVAYDAGTYKTIGASHEFGWLQNTANGTKLALMEKYLIHFGILQTGCTANFMANVTSTCSGDQVQYTDMSTGMGITSWEWTFEGGNPAISNEQNPVVTYETPGNYDVTLTVTNSSGSNTLSKTDYILVMNVPETPGNITGSNDVCQGEQSLYTVPPVFFATSYNWEMNPPEAGTMVSDGNQCTITWGYSYAGTVTLSVCGMNDCGEGAHSPDFVVELFNCTGLGEKTLNESFTIQPNPNSGVFSIIYNSAVETNIEVIDLLGNRVYSEKSESLSHSGVRQIDLSHLPDGVYYVAIQSNTEISVKKLVISK